MIDGSTTIYHVDDDCSGSRKDSHGISLSIDALFVSFLELAYVVLQ